MLLLLFPVSIAGLREPLSVSHAVAAENQAAVARSAWIRRLAATLESRKSYPAAAAEQRQEGAVTMRLALDRSGQILSVRIERSSGFSLLDQEALALVQRAKPLPPAPAAVPGDHFEVLVPLVFRYMPGPPTVLKGR